MNKIMSVPQDDCGGAGYDPVGVTWLWPFERFTGFDHVTRNHMHSKKLD